MLVDRRIPQVTGEIRALSFKNCGMSVEEKLNYILSVIADETVRDCARWGEREEELESRILSGIRSILLKETIAKKSELYFVYELLDSLLRYEKDEEDYRKIEAAIRNPRNPMHIGKIFYDKLEKR